MKKRLFVAILFLVSAALCLIYARCGREKAAGTSKNVYDMDKIIAANGLRPAKGSPGKFNYETLISTLGVFVEHLMRNYTEDAYFRGVKASMRNRDAACSLINGVLRLIKNDLIESPQNLAQILERHRGREKEDCIIRRINESFLLSLIYKCKNSENGARIMKQAEEDLEVILRDPELLRIESSVWFQLRMGTRSFKRGLIEYYYQWICSYLMELSRA
jgi:hypothetical protein